MGLKIHHLNCATLCPLGRSLFNSQGKLWQRAKLVCHCLLIETSQGLVLVDSGLGCRDILHTKLSDGLFSMLARPQFLFEETALAQINQLGFNSSDVRHIILTHLDQDHAGGISDFPEATIHVMADEWEAANNPQSFKERFRYNPKQWSHQPHWQTHTARSGEQWHDFKKISLLNEGLPEIGLIPLAGHTRGHCGVAIMAEDGWKLHAGDTYFKRSELVNVKTSASNAETRRLAHASQWLKVFHSLDSDSNRTRIHNLNKLHQLMEGQTIELDIFCSHDIDEFHSHKL